MGILKTTRQETLEEEEYNMSGYNNSYNRYGNHTSNSMYKEYKEFVKSTIKERMRYLNQHAFSGTKYYKGIYDGNSKRVEIDEVNPFTGDKIRTHVVTPKINIVDGDKVVTILAILKDLTRRHPNNMFACKIVAVETAKIEELNFSIRLTNYLKKSGINTVGELLQRNMEEILTVVSCEPILVKEIKEKFAKWG